MSTKGSLFLTKDNEHWYHDCIDGSITIEISKENVQDFYSDETDYIIEIKKGCDLWNYLNELRSVNFKENK
jgi:hypothetical protein